MLDSNLWSAIGAAAGTGLITYFVNRSTRNFDARGQAEAALIGIGPKIIEEQNKRIDSLTKSLDLLWAAERKCQVDLGAALARIAALERGAT